MQWQVLDRNTKAIGFYECIGGTVVKEWLTVRMHHPELGRFAAGEASTNNNTPSKSTNWVTISLCITQTTFTSTAMEFKKSVSSNSNNCVIIIIKSVSTCENQVYKVSHITITLEYSGSHVDLRVCICLSQCEGTLPFHKMLVQLLRIIVHYLRTSVCA